MPRVASLAAGPTASGAPPAMNASRSHLCLYDAARQAIRDASAGGAAAEAVGRDQDACVATRPQHDDVLDKKLHRSVEEMYHSIRGQQNSSTQGTQDVQLSASDSGVGNKKRQLHDGEEAPTEDAGDASDGEEGHATTQEDEFSVPIACSTQRGNANVRSALVGRNGLQSQLLEGVSERPQEMRLRHTTHVPPKNAQPAPTSSSPPGAYGVISVISVW
ncbi:unnamed protein product [Ectocarpus sp. 6 AP-2014]